MNQFLKITKILILLFIVFTLFLNLISLSFVKNYENTYAEYNRTLIGDAGNDTSNLKEACLNLNQPIEEYLFYKKITAWSFMAIIISFLAIFIEFALIRLKIILFSSKDWKCLRILTFAVFLSVFIFVYTFWIMADDFYLAICMGV